MVIERLFLQIFDYHNQTTINTETLRFPRQIIIDGGIGAK